MLFGRRRHAFGTSADRATFRTQHTASVASPPLRAGLTEASARNVRSGTARTARSAVGGDHLLAWDGIGNKRHDAARLSREAC